MNLVTVAPHKQPTPLAATQSLLDVSVTERRSFRTCRRRWFYTVIQNLTRRGAPEWHFEFGTACHTVLERFYMGGEINLEDHVHDVFDQWPEHMALQYEIMYDSEIDELDALQELAFGMFDNYAEYLLSPDAKAINTGTPLAVEGIWTPDAMPVTVKRPQGYPADAEVFLDRESGRFLVPIVNPYTKEVVYQGDSIVCLTAQIDLLAQGSPPRSGLGIVDHKTAGSAPNDRGMDFDDQITGYNYVVWRWIAVLVRWTMFNYLIKDVPKLPRILQRGDLSTAKDQATTPAMYLRALREHGHVNGTRFTSRRHGDCYSALLERGWDPWFRRFVVTRNMAQVMNFERRLFHEYVDMRNCLTDPDKRYPNHSTMHCPGCPAREICQAHEDDTDIQYVIETSFKQGIDRKA